MTDELSRHDFNAHPVTRLLNHISANPERPKKAELDALELPPIQRSRVAEAVEEVADLKAAGRNRDAKRAAEDAAQRIVNGLGPDHRRPDYLDPPDTEPNDPHALAARVTRW